MRARVRNAWASRHGFLGVITEQWKTLVACSQSSYKWGNARKPLWNREDLWLARKAPVSGEESSGDVTEWKARSENAHGQKKNSL